MSGDHKHRLAEGLEERFAALETEFHRAYWESQVDATEGNDRRRAEAELELRRAKGDPDALRLVSDALTDEVHAPKLRRQLEVLRLSLMANQMDEARRAELVALSGWVESDFANFRPTVGETRLDDNEIVGILKTSDDPEEREGAWEASKEIGGVVADRVRELARVRNSVARDLGYADHFALALDLKELSEGWLFNTLGELELMTDEPFRAFRLQLDGSLKRRFNTDRLYPWHYADPFFQNAPPEGRVDLDPLLQDASAAELAERTFAGIGIDISDVLKDSDLYPREHKCQHAFCLDVDRSGEDIRILANIVPGERWAEVMLHESGHAAYDVEIDHRTNYLLHRPAHAFVTEAIALLAGRLVRDPEWLVEAAGVPADRVSQLSDRLRAAAAAQVLVFVRWGLVMVHFERALYADPESDLDARWWELVERFQLVTPPPDRKAPDWAAKIHIAVAPVYYHNYLLGEMLASQLRRALDDAHGGLVGRPGAGALLREGLFRHGALQRWDQVIESCLGEPLSPRALASDLRWASS